MKKIILSLAFFVATSMGLYAAEATHSNSVAASQIENSKDGKKERKGDKKEGKKDKKKDGKKGGKVDRARFNNPFEGIELTPEQQAQLKELQQSLRPSDKKLSDEEKAQMTEEQKKQLKEELKAKRENFRKDYLAGVKNILTPEQYVKFLENNYLQGGYDARGTMPMRDINGRRPGERKLLGSPVPQTAQ